MDTRTQRYRYNPEPPHLQALQGWENIEFRTFPSADDVPDGEGWVNHPDFAVPHPKMSQPHPKMSQISPVAADPYISQADIAEEIPASGEPPRSKRGRKPKGA